MRGMLENLTVIDITNNIAGPGCAAMLADHGAEVIHVEKPIFGDDCRHFFPTIGKDSASHFYANRNKKSVVLDLKDPVGARVIKKLAETADILIESNRPGVMDRLGLGYDVLHAINPRLIYCSISAFGQHGPYAEKAGYDIIAQAYSSMMYYTGEADSGPVKNYFAIGDFVCAYNAYGTIMTALYHRERTGKGQYLDVALARDLPLPPSVTTADACPAIYGFADYSDAEIRFDRAPDLGEHSLEILTRCGLSPADAEAYEEKWNRR